MLCSILFILSLGGLSKQESARRGNIFGIISMVLAIASTFFLAEFDNNFLLFVPAFVVAGLIGLVLALKVEMISMPQMVAALHSFVGLAATLVSYSKYLAEMRLGTEMGNLEKIEGYIGVFMGAITFTGSLVACGKLQGLIRSSPLMILGPGRHVINILIIAAIIVFGYFFLVSEAQVGLEWLLGMTGLSLFLGWHLVMAIGGADMPVVVSMLNSYSGWTTSASGFLLENNLLIITGALVGSSGAILSYIMCAAMNRSFFSVILGGFGQGTVTSAPSVSSGTQTEINCQNLVKTLKSAKSVVIVPGYGMAVAKAQRDVGALADALKKMGKKVRFCIHPVAGRLPGHMNVLLAEANVPYDIVKEMDDINGEFPKTDVSLIIGANDIVNPDAQDNPNSAIAGMPVCEVWKGKTTVVFKRGGGTGYAGIENPLFVKPNTRMYFGSADKSMKEILEELNKQGVGIDLSKDQNNAIEEESQEEQEEDLPEPKMTIGVPKEVEELEKRVSVTPNLVKKFRKLGFDVLVESGAGEPAGFWNSEYEKYGAQVVDTERIWTKSDIVLKVRRPFESELEYLSNIKMLVSYVYPAQNYEFVENLANNYPNLTVVGMDCVPRITRAQKLDSLSSMANIKGYRAVIESLEVFQKCPKAMITAAGKLPPAKVFIIGCGVAGLSAIGYCRSLGCVVKAFDSRSAAREQAESLGAEFIEVNVQEEGGGYGGYAKEMSDAYKQAQLEMTKKVSASVDIVITTALIPGKPAPKLITEDIVRAMRPGSVILDMAAEMGGNCELTSPGKTVQDEDSGVYIIGYTDLESRMAPQSSELYSNNLWHLMDEFGGAENLKVNLEDEIQDHMVVVHEGKVTWRPIEQRAAAKPPQKAAPPVKPAEAKPIPQSKEPEEKESYAWVLGIILLIAVFVCVAQFAEEILNLFLVFVLAICVGYMVVWNVTPSLHTPLMSVTNAISGIIVIGAMLELTPVKLDVMFDESNALGVASLFLASINVVGGFIVTARMLAMFRKD